MVTTRVLSFPASEYNGYFEIVESSVLGGPPGQFVARVYSRNPHHLLHEKFGTMSVCQEFIEEQMKKTKLPRKKPVAAVVPDEASERLAESAAAPEVSSGSKFGSLLKKIGL